MEQPKSRFLAELGEGLGNHREKNHILKEYELHLDDLLVEFSHLQEEHEIRKQLEKRLGSPQEIAAIWKDELSVTPSKMKWLFFFLNIVFFTVGSLLTLFHNIYEWTWLKEIWGHITAIPIVIAFIYLFFWVLLGYEIGKGFGYKGKRLLKITFLLSLIPNMILMALTVFKVIPHEWFAPLLTRQFIVICILFTLILYPVSFIGYTWGKKASL